VTFFDGGSHIGSATLNSGGTAAIATAQPLAVGSHAITASYGGDRNFAASTGSLTQTVSQAATTTTTTLTSSANPSVTAQAVTYTATVKSMPDGGTVAFSDGGTPIAGCGAQQVDTSTGTATCQETYTKPGTYSNHRRLLRRHRVQGQHRLADPDRQPGRHEHDHHGHLLARPTGDLPDSDLHCHRQPRAGRRHGGIHGDVQ
jgi:hypothetical protein